MKTLYDKNGNAINIPLEEDFNRKVDIYARVITELPKETNESYLFYAQNDLYDQYGTSIAVYSRGIFININGSTDGALIAINAARELFIGFRNNGNWTIRQI